ncbi:MAG: hypothetical protein K2X82_16505 [Gemmataceae bacterium]|nr:hypothetical protein [Gemmataceae bacterium]
MAKVKATFYLPTRDNDGRDLVPGHKAVENGVYDLCDGWTYTGYVDGAYRMADGSPSFDRSRAYIAVMDEPAVAALKELLRAFKSATLQEAIYLEVQHGVEFSFV